VSAGARHTCAVKCDGQLVCFGNDSGQCNVPADLGPVVTVSAGEDHTCAVKCDGQLVCFGDNDYGQCNVPADLGPVLALSNDSEATSERIEPSFVMAPTIVEEHVQHIEPPTHIPPTEAAEIVAEQHASWIVNNLDASTNQFFDDADAEMEALMLLQFSRSTDAFQSALSASRELEPVRAALFAAGHRSHLPSGANILTDPGHFRAACLAVAGRVLQPCHVIVTESLEPLVNEVVSQLPCNQKIRLRRAESVGYVGQASSEELKILLVRRTFLEVPQSILRAPASVVQTTTEAMERRAVNPRRWA